MAQPVELPDSIHVGPVIDPGHSLASVSDKVGGIVLKRRITLGWVFGLLISFAILQNLAAGATWLLIKGVGIWGINIPVGWGFAIVNFVWWIGIGHAGTLISAILLLLNQSWRNAINRFAEAMTLFAVMCAGMFPVLHTGRPWLAFWLLPYPNTMALWPQMRSPLLWDVFAVSTYLTISAVFWFVGLLPDLATLRDSAKSRTSQVIYGLLSMGWRNSARHWQRYEKASLLLAGLALLLGAVNVYARDTQHLLDLALLGLFWLNPILYQYERMVAWFTHRGWPSWIPPSSSISPFSSFQLQIPR